MPLHISGHSTQGVGKYVGMVAMARLNASALGKLSRTPGKHGDGDGLFLVVQQSGSASWIVRVQKNGKRRDIGVGSLAKVPLALARKRAEEVRMQMEVGIDPVEHRKRAVGIPTFREAAAAVHAEQKAAWRNSKHGAQWLSSLNEYAYPAIGDLSVNAVEPSQVRDLLAGIWHTKHETARRVRQRIRSVIDWAVAKGYRDDALPMAIINRGLPPRPTKAERHHEALPYAELPEFMAKLRERETMGRLALEAAILTAARSGEVRGATWDEIDLQAGLWTIPASRMKAKRHHVVPLSAPALAVFSRAWELAAPKASLVFGGTKAGKPLSDMTLTKILRDMGLTVTAHGFRSTFRDWVGEETDFPGEVAEAALAHVLKNKTEAAYRRGNSLEKRRMMMEAWGLYCGGATGAASDKLSVAK